MELERNVKNKVDRMRNDEVFQRAKEERLILNILKKYSHSLIGHKTRHNDLNINQLDALNFIMSLFHASICFEHHMLIVRRPKLYYTVSGIITLKQVSGLIYMHSK